MNRTRALEIGTTRRFHIRVPYWVGSGWGEGPAGRSGTPQNTGKPALFGAGPCASIACPPGHRIPSCRRGPMAENSRILADALPRPPIELPA